MKNTILLLLLFVHSVANAQWQWARTAGGDTSYNLAADVQLSASFTDGQGNTYITGNMNSTSATFGSHVLTVPGFFIVKYDAAGTALWAKDASGGGIGIALCTDAGGNVYVSGTASSSMSFGSSTLINTGISDIFVVKYDPAGTVLWAKSAVGTGTDNVTDIASDAGGNVVITGFFQGPALSFGMHHVVGSNIPSWYMAKYDASGNELWAKGATGGVFIYGGRQSLAINTAGEIYLGGSFTTSIALGTCPTCSLSQPSPVSPDIFLAKYDTSGNGIWAKSATGIGSDMLNDVALDAAGNLYATGKFNGAQISFGTQTLTNSTNPSMFLVKYDSSGNNIWAHRSVNKGFLSEGVSLAADVSGGIYLTGLFRDTVQDGAATIVSNGQTDVFVAKYSGAGSIDWALSAGGSANENALGLGTDAAGNAYIAGWFSSSSINFGSYSLSANFTAGNDFTAKFDAAGNALWAKKSINTHYNNHTDAAVSSMRLDASGNVCATGVFRQKMISFGSFTLFNTDTSGLTKDIFVVKYDPSGAVLWAKSLGSPTDDSAHAIACDSGGDIYIGGTFFGPIFTAGTVSIVNSGAAYQDGFLVKLDASGGTVWAKKIGGADHDAVNDIATDAAGNILVTGFFTMNMMVDNFPLATMSTDPNMFVIKYDSGGNALWAKRGGSPLPTDGMGVSTDTMNNVFVSGTFFDDIYFSGFNGLSAPSYNRFVVKYSPAGNPLFWKIPSGLTLPSQMRALVDAHAAGTVTVYFDWNLVRMDDSLNYINTVTENDAIFTNLYTDAIGYRFVTGYFESSSIQLGGINLANAGGDRNFFAARYTSNHQVLWAKNLGHSEGHSIMTNAAGDIFMAGKFTTPSLPIGSDTLVSAFGSNIFIAKMADPLGIDETVNQSRGFSVFPNPVSSFTTIETGAPFKDATLTITNALGQVVRQADHLFGTSVRVSRNNIPAGMYILHLTEGDKKLGTAKMLVQD